MKRVATALIAYFPVLLVSLQVLGNLLYFIDRDFYISKGFYLNLTIGTNLLFPIFMLAITLKFKFCSVSKWAATAECLFAIYYLVVQKDDVYNILFQITTGAIALVITFFHFIKKFPLCMASTWVNLIKHLLKSFFKEGDCSKGVTEWANDHRKIVSKNLINGTHS